MAKYDVKDYVIIVFFSYAVVTILNVLIHYAFPSIPIIRSGFALILLMISILLVLLFTVARDGKLDKEDVLAILVVVGIMFVIYFALNHFVPGLFSALPSWATEGVKEAFSILGV